MRLPANWRQWSLFFPPKPISPQVFSEARCLFSPEWYLTQLRDTVRTDLFVHYLKIGWKQGLDPNPFFQTKWYLTCYPDVEVTNECPFVHYLRTGAAEGRNPSPVFLTWWYLKNNPDVYEAGSNPLLHFWQFGNQERRSPCPLWNLEWFFRNTSESDLLTALLNIRNNGWHTMPSPHPLFDSRWYLAAYPNVPDNLNPLEHYLIKGWKEGCRPNPVFIPSYYHEQYPDTRWLEPLTHFVAYGRAEGKDPTFIFNEVFYRSINLKIRQDEDALAHYVIAGAREGYDPNPFFHNSWYRLQVDHDLSSLTPYGHYLLFGARSGKNPSPLFDGPWYLRSNSDVAQSGRNPLEHFLRHGFLEGRSPVPRETKLAPPTVLRRGDNPWVIPPAIDLQERKVLLVACHDERKLYGKAVRHLVNGFRTEGWVVILTYDHKIDREQFISWSDSDLPHAVCAIDHTGYDFYSWRLAWGACKDIEQARRVALMNDSVIGPTKSLSELLQLVELHTADVLGFVESGDIMAHLQSWGLVFGVNPICDGAIRRFLDQVDGSWSKIQLIARAEVPFARWLTLQGYSVASICSPVSLIRSQQNPILEWRRVLNAGIPFVKREMFAMSAYQSGQLPIEILEQLEKISQCEIRPLVEDSLAQIGLELGRPWD
ncbi:rhamnan synthesis F family protein [Desulfobulbus alkaliphilus]|uniref:rhamnan synthesis F family protein n=1 Tax=Desulfobulbus alkaliphilus TaxID=869814 RepID=UPI001963619B|nr:rhamnan synthesis F family protein [Desulfobulbus alkaliphilus]MBM9537370.1 hypothetical protein [Desulfobulbus alkaliphilus]